MTPSKEEMTKSEQIATTNVKEAPS